MSVCSILFSFGVMGSVKWNQVQTSRSDLLLGRVGEVWVKWHPFHLSNWCLQCFGMFNSFCIRVCPISPFFPGPIPSLFLSLYQSVYVPSIFLFCFSLRPGCPHKQKCLLYRDQLSGFLLKAKAATTSISPQNESKGGSSAQNKVSHVVLWLSTLIVSLSLQWWLVGL